MSNSAKPAAENITLKELKKGDFFKRKQDAKTIFIRGDYVPELKKYSCIDAEDCNREIFLQGKAAVFVDFEY